jgi:hypothetical protein
MAEQKKKPTTSRLPIFLFIAATGATVWWLLAGPDENFGPNGTPGSIALACWIVYVIALVEHAWHQRKRPPDSGAA